jgi:hypothetical protein
MAKLRTVTAILEMILRFWEGFSLSGISGPSSTLRIMICK